MQATLLIYSGRPNPSWTIDPERADEIEAAIRSVPPATPESPPFGGLGYSGVQLDFVGADGKSHRAVFGSGTALIDGRPGRDEDRRIERALLATGRGKVSEVDGLA